MQELKQIQAFFFDEAKYKIVDRKGREALLAVNYAGNSFRIVGSKIDPKAKKELSDFATDMLNRKHGKNFVS